MRPYVGRFDADLSDSIPAPGQQRCAENRATEGVALVMRRVRLMSAAYEKTLWTVP